VDFFSKKNIRIILLLILFTAVVFAAVWNLPALWSLLSKLLRVLSPVILGICIAFVLNVFVSFFERKVFVFLRRKKRRWVKRLCRPLSIATTFLILIALLLLLIFFILPEIAGTIGKLATDLPTHISALLDTVRNFLLRRGMPTDFLPSYDGGWSDLLKPLTDFLNKGSSALWKTVSAFATSVFGKLFNILFAFIIAIYILLQKEMVLRFADKVCAALCSYKQYHRFRRFMVLVNRSFCNFVTGQFIEAVILGLLCFFGMLILQMPYALLISVIILLSALIPMVGAIIGAGCGMLLILTENPIKALVFLAFIIALQEIEGNFIYPKVVGKSVGLPGLTVLIAVTVGGNIGGIAGMLMGVPICSILYVLLSQWMQKRLNRRQILEPLEDEPEVPTPKTPQGSALHFPGYTDVSEMPDAEEPPKKTDTETSPSLANDTPPAHSATSEEPQKQGPQDADPAPSQQHAKSKRRPSLFRRK